MEQMASLQFWVGFGQIVLINVLLSGDNAVVIALACRHLPRRQRALGIFWGGVGAIVLRCVLTYFAVAVLRLPYVKLLGAFMLLWIAITLLADESAAAGEVTIKSAQGLMEAVRTIVIADVIMSLDNVVGVAAAAKDSVLLLVLGLLISIPLIIGASQLILKLIERFPALVVAGAGLLAYVAAELALSDPLIETWSAQQTPLRFGVPLACSLFVIAVGRWWAKRQVEDADVRDGIPLNGVSSEDGENRTP